MPYFVYKVFPAKRYELVETFEKYRDARGLARTMRSELKKIGTTSLSVWSTLLIPRPRRGCCPSDAKHRHLAKTPKAK